ncbi:MAG: hypothetical protein PHI97_12080 [Desulfobulbus sp.]|nr:hypothetical protein [Desulfobulbus sp.]
MKDMAEKVGRDFRPESNLFLGDPLFSCTHSQLFGEYSECSQEKIVINMLFLFNKLSDCSSREHVLNFIAVRFQVIVTPQSKAKGLADDLESCCYREQLGGVRTCPLSFMRP